MARKDGETYAEVAIVPLGQQEGASIKLHYRYKTGSHYALRVTRGESSWSARLALAKLPENIEKQSIGHLFEEHVEEPRVFAAEVGGKRVGWLETGYQGWNNRMRVWQLLVEEEHRGRGIGARLMETAIKVAEERGARMLVLETQSCNVQAIAFYMKLGYELIGFDSAHYSNEDVEKGEVRLEFGLPL
ncbi:MAG: GNAT family N-acetyltransferase [Thermoplasmata archaeon]